jgi:O-antigen/teichoic acid export membrane protein
MIADGLEHRAAKVSLVNGLSTLLTLVFQLISVPVCLRYWGKEAYGGWLSLFSAFLMLRSLDGGFVAYVGNKLNYLFHKDIVALRNHMASAVTGIIVIGSLQLLLALATLIAEPLASALGVPPLQADRSVQLGLLALVISWILTGSYLGIVHRLMIPAGMMYQAAWWAMVFQITQFIAIMLAALLQLGMLSTSLLFATSQIVVYAASGLYIKRVLPGFYPWLQSPNRRVGLRDLSRSVPLTLSNIIQQGALNGVVLLIAVVAGPRSVPIFTTVRTLSNLWTSVSTVLATPLLPEVVRLHAKGETAKLAAVNSAFWVLVGTAVSGGAVLLFPLIPFCYGLWTGHTVDLDKPLLSLMLASVVVTNSSALMALHLNGINRLHIVLATSIVRAVLGLGCGAMGYRFWGLASFGVGILLGELAATGLIAQHFVKFELRAKGFRMPASEFGPVTLSTGSAVLFFLGTAFGWRSNAASWLLAMSAIFSSWIWGWTSLDRELRTRLRTMATKWMPLA